MQKHLWNPYLHISGYIKHCFYPISLVYRTYYGTPNLFKRKIFIYLQSHFSYDWYEVFCIHNPWLKIRRFKILTNLNDGRRLPRNFRNALAYEPYMAKNKKYLLNIPTSSKPGASLSQSKPHRINLRAIKKRVIVCLWTLPTLYW